MNILWKGPNFKLTSLSIINYYTCLALLKTGKCDLSIELDKFGLERTRNIKDPYISRLKRLIRPSNRYDVTIQHHFPPDFTPPKDGHWVIFQPWEYGSMPKEWFCYFRDWIDEIWAPSDYVKECFTKDGIAQDKIRVVPYGLSPVLEYRKSAHKDFRFLFAGGTIWRKGIDILLDAYKKAFRKTENITLIIKDMGASNFYKKYNYSQKIKDAIKDKSFPKIIYIQKDYKNFYQMPKLYQDCDCLVHPYRGEGFGLPVAEAMACGLPVILSKGGACDYFAPEEDVYWIKSELKKFKGIPNFDFDTVRTPELLNPDINSLCENMREVFENPDIAREKGKRASLYVNSILSWDKTANIILERLDTLKQQPILRFKNSVFGTKASNQVKVDIIIINTNTKKYMARLIKSTFKYTKMPFEIIVIDNASKDGSRRWLEQNKKVTSIFNSENLGYAKSANQGIKKGNSKYIIIMNSDIIVSKDWLKYLVEVMESDKKIAVAGPKIYNFKGKLNSCGFIGDDEASLTIRGWDEEDKGQYNKTEEVKCVCGAAYMIRRELLPMLGYFDENYFLYFEETDYSRNARAKGYKVMYCPKSVIKHYIGVNAKMDTRNITYQDIFNKSREYFMKKWGDKIE